MKRFLILTILVGVLSSFTRDSYPCHSYDTGACTHPQHAYDYNYNVYGQMYTYPCTHPQHAYDIYPCSHVCY